MMVAFSKFTWYDELIIAMKAKRKGGEGCVRRE
jgi:hypothetical protein